MSQGNFGCRMPVWLGSPMSILWWDMDEVVVIMISLTVAILAGGWGWLLLFCAPYGYIWIKKNYPRGYLKHLLYAVGLVRFEGYPSHFEKHFSE